MAINLQLADSSGKLNYPSNWPSKFVSGDASRFAARFRAAKSANIDFGEVFSESKISDAYSSFIKLFLAFSAFEIFQAAFSLDARVLDSKYNGADVVQKLKKIHLKSPQFFNFIESKLDNGAAKKNLQKLTGGKDVCGIYLAKSFRHIFAHGILTPSAAGSDPIVTKEIGDILYQHLMRIMDSEAAIAAKKLLKSS